jgi:hypothetical protein
VIALVLGVLRQVRAPQPPPITVQRGVTVTPDTVTVGEPFRLTVRIHAPLGATIEFPNGPDSGATVEALDSKQVRATPDSTAVDQTVTYRLAAWDVGWQPLRVADVIVKLDAQERRVSLGAVRVFVRSVLPADSAQRIPKPARPIFEFGRPWWFWLLMGLLALGLIGLFIWWWRRRRRAKPEAAVDPYEEAERRFAHVESLELIEAGERGRHVALMVEVLREYTAQVIEEAAAALTTTELLVALRGTSRVPTTRLASVLSEADLIKFAARTVSADRARELGREARAIARVVHETGLAAQEQAA